MPTVAARLRSEVLLIPNVWTVRCESYRRIPKADPFDPLAVQERLRCTFEDKRGRELFHHASAPGLIRLTGKPPYTCTLTPVNIRSESRAGTYASNLMAIDCVGVSGRERTRIR